MTNFSTSKDSLYPNGQLVVGFDKDSIYEGMCAYMKHEVPECEFSPEEYNKEAYQEFLNAIL